MNKTKAITINQITKSYLKSKIKIKTYNILKRKNKIIYYYYLKRKNKILGKMNASLPKKITI